MKTCSNDCKLKKKKVSQPKQLGNAALAEAVSALSLPRITQHHATVLAAILGLGRHDEVVLKTTTQREEGLLLLQSNLLLPPVHTARQGHDLQKATKHKWTRYLHEQVSCTGEY